VERGLGKLATLAKQSKSLPAPYPDPPAFGQGKVKRGRCRRPWREVIVKREQKKTRSRKIDIFTQYI